MNITIRVSEELATEIEKKRGDKSKADFYREILEHYLGSSVDGANMHEPEKDVSKSKYVLRLEDEVKYLRAKVDDLLKTLNQEQVLHLQIQRMLPEKSEEKEVKHWWQVWKK